jgi:hypothetical protein
MTIENEIDEGRFDVAMFAGGGDKGVDITEAVLENNEVSMALDKFYGQDNMDATQYLARCKVLLSSKPTADPNLIELKLNFYWNDRNYEKNKFTHNVELQLLKRKE